MNPNTGSFDAAAIHGDPRPEDVESARMPAPDRGGSTRMPERSVRSLTRALALRMPTTAPDAPASPPPPGID